MRERIRCKRIFHFSSSISSFHPMLYEFLSFLNQFHSCLHIINALLCFVCQTLIFAMCFFGKIHKILPESQKARRTFIKKCRRFRYRRLRHSLHNGRNQGDKTNRKSGREEKTKHRYIFYHKLFLNYFCASSCCFRSPKSVSKEPPASAMASTIFSTWACSVLIVDDAFRRRYFSVSGSTAFIPCNEACSTI